MSRWVRRDSEAGSGPTGGPLHRPSGRKGSIVRGGQGSHALADVRGGRWVPGPRRGYWVCVQTSSGRVRGRSELGPQDGDETGAHRGWGPLGSACVGEGVGVGACVCTSIVGAGGRSRRLRDPVGPASDATRRGATGGPRPGPGGAGETRLWRGGPVGGRGGPGTPTGTWRLEGPYSRGPHQWAARGPATPWGRSAPLPPRATHERPTREGGRAQGQTRP